MGYAAATQDRTALCQHMRTPSFETSGGMRMRPTPLLKFVGTALVAMSVAFFAGCGGSSSSTSSSPETPVAKTAVVIGQVTLPAALKAAGDPIEVRVVGADPPISTMVG